MSGAPCPLCDGDGGLVIARFEGDAQFPAPIWAPARRDSVPVLACPLQEVDAAIAQSVASATRMPG